YDVDNSINFLRARAGMPDMKLSELTVDPYMISYEYGYRNLASLAPSNLAVLLEIRRERTIELCLEDSRRWDDIVRWKEGKCYEQPLTGMYFPGPGEYDLTGDGVPDVCLYATSKAPEGNTNLTYIQIQEITIDGKNVPYSDGIVLSEGDHGYMDMFRLRTRSFDENRDYLYPIPTGDRFLNLNLTQNPGWNDGLENYNPDDEEDEDEEE
ncbi:MAG: RagB/SusD family nutrient uptake outer membrane protein, partial [Bacteroidales bacterium]|nr:RagB/SusD family nutrient uptake outer membrane protein [Bacteroidales bacterium]